MKRKAGRPRLSKSKTVRMTITLPDALLKDVMSRADNAGMTLSEYVRSILEK